MKTCIIIPAFNEAKRLPVDEFLEFLASNKSNYFCFANDGSSDETIKVLHKIRDKYPEYVKIIDFERNEGKAETIRKAMQHLLKEKKYDSIGFFDADLATPLSEIERFKKELVNNPELLLVMGSRFKRLGATIDRKFKRFLFGRIFATIVSYFVLKFPVYDTQCGAKLFSTKISVSVFEKPFITRWIFDVEILLRMKNNLELDIYKTVLELPLKTWIEKGESKIRFSDLLKVPFDLIRLNRTN
ncbi:glycosyltransferase [Flavicella marina]|uniref:glycosyltransferase n=1 Tax=Flavicella marina TaxID=1475951 RepID=UPI001264CBA7|nr:glycosyltransferase [Flavicella marina]